MKISIVTFPKAINYGTSLQAAALREVLLHYADEVDFARHDCPLIDSSNAVFDVANLTDIKYTAAHLINLTNAVKRKKNFEKFFDDFIPVNELSESSTDVIVAGSDQIWNYNLTDGDMFYFLDFPKTHAKKTAYAGSFGLSHIDDRYTEPIKRCLEDFDAVSVREQTAAKLINEITGASVPVVLDPTLLLNKNEWGKFADKNAAAGKYIFVYTVFNSEKLWDFAYKLSEVTGLPIKTISYSKLHRHNADYSFTAGPAQWLGYMMNAEYVVTNSFHGFAFSVNFAKKFYFELPPSASGVSSRLSDMAARYSLGDREISVADISVPADIRDVSRQLQTDREHSLTFISDHIISN